MDASVNYRLRAAGYTLFLTDEEAVFVLRHGRGNVARGSGGNVIRMSFTDGRGSQRVVGEGAVATRLNYYRGRVPSGWHAGVASLAQVRYSEVYSGIDALFHTGNGKVEYDFVVRPDADPSAIQLAFKGAQGLRLGADGELVLQTTAGSLIQGAPVAYQLQDGERRNVPVRYRLGEDQRVGFALGAYDPGRTLVIDPDVDYATYLGGDAAADIAFTVVVDANGYIYLAGSTYSDDFPAIDGTTFGGEIDAFVAKLDRTQTGTDQLVYATFLGGNAPEDSDKVDQAWGIVVDGAQYLYVAGATDSVSFPTTLEAYDRTLGGPRDAFVAKLDTISGSLEYSTLLGGGLEDEANGIAIDASGRAVVAGRTSSTDFPVVDAVQTSSGGADDAFVTMLAPDGSGLVYSTYLGGNASDYAHGVALDAEGGAYAAGRTASPSFGEMTLLAGGQGGSTTDAFVAKLEYEESAGLELEYLLFLGGDDNDVARAIAVDGAGCAYITGRTTSQDFPSTPGAYQEEIAGELTKQRGINEDAFIAKVEADGSGLVYATYLGGAGVDIGYGIVVNASGHAYVVGTTDSLDFPLEDEFQGSLGGTTGRGKNLMEDAFVTVVNAEGSDLLLSSYYGGTDHDMGRGIAIDQDGACYIVGRTASDDLRTDEAYDAILGGAVDAFLARIAP